MGDFFLPKFHLEKYKIGHFEHIAYRLLPIATFGI